MYTSEIKKSLSMQHLRIAVIIPCYNEEKSIATVVLDFADSLPEADIYVYDNNSTDRTREEALKAGAVVRSEPRQGKGFVVRRMFADIEADVFLMIDGDNTYDAKRSRELVQKLVEEGLDMVNAVRVEQDVESAYRPGHKFGNMVLTGFVSALFGQGFRDLLSGYRVFSRRFVKSFPATSTGFEIETELTVHALDLEMPIAEVETAFQDRVEGSQSKLRTYADGFRILWTIAKLMKRERPVVAFGFMAAVAFALAVYFVAPVAFTYIETGLVPRYPTLIISSGLCLVSLLCIGCGLILDTVTFGRREQKRLFYLSMPGIQSIAKNASDEPLNGETASSV
jgi:glycosyltransferase involved in cell wall biosynthesis